MFCAYEAETEMSVCVCVVVFQNKKMNGQGEEMDDGRISEVLGGGSGVVVVVVQIARLALGPRSPLTRFMWFMARSKASRTAFRTLKVRASVSLILSSVWLIPKGAILDLGSHCLRREETEVSV